MSNGQMNVASVQTVTQIVTPDSSASAAVTMDDAEQNTGIFAGVLNGIQHAAKGKVMPDSGQTEQSPVKIGKHHLHLDAGAEPTVDLLAQLQVSQGSIPVSEPAVSKAAEPENDNISADAVPLHSEQSDVASQMAMAAFLQTGGMPGVSILTQLPADTLQKVAAVTDQPVDISAATVTLQPDQVVAAPTQAQQVIAPPAKETAPESSSQQSASGRMPEVNILAQLPVDKLQKVATVTEQPAVIVAATDKMPLEQKVAGPIQAPQVISPVQLSSVKESAKSSPQPVASSGMPGVNLNAEEASTQPVASNGMPGVNLNAEKAPSAQLVASNRMPEVNKLTPLPVDEVQNQANVTDQPALNSAVLGKIQVEQTTAEPVQKNQAEKLAAPSLTPKSELPTAQQNVPATVSSPESEVEIQLSQPQPITARVTAEPALTGNRQAVLVSETRGGRQRFTTEQQIEKVRSGNEANAVKETASSLQAVASDGESELGSDTSRGNNNQGQSDSASDNQMLAQQMHGQLSTEHQKVAAFSAKVVPTDPGRQQDIPQQVMQQVKDRLEQHDVKPGNQQITLTLSPGSLGELKMNLNLQGQKLSVEIVTENRTVRDAIVQHTDALKESLARQNITMESFDVTTGGKGSGHQGQNHNAWRELAKQQQQQQSWASPRGYQIAQADLPSGQAAYQRQQGHSMLDIHY